MFELACIATALLLISPELCKIVRLACTKVSIASPLAEVERTNTLFR